MTGLKLITVYCLFVCLPPTIPRLQYEVHAWELDQCLVTAVRLGGLDNADK